MGLNYGAERLRFPAAVPEGSRIRFRATLKAADPVGETAVQITVHVVAELEGSEKPACAVDILARYYF